MINITRKEEILNLLEYLPPMSPMAYYQKSDDIIYVTMGDHPVEETFLTSWLVSMRGINSGSWMGFQLRGTSKLFYLLNLNPTKSPRFLASCFNSFLKTFFKKPR